ncbi:hypothetical protein F4703DRAFT_1796692 [Phycomyces blakesleeanus]|uniref:Uncharacterized protein n=1 Tax=Phycomyces blakesleeanus (strain ATCC 8743b / DSM 1359 / FGSC 10004 / NBRC 33097 / NRRL 1555) TaxID=763407 RepID=A0A167JIR0_PHYB8|nr:hypothetical protein PHYBLDRAFT_69891 [Phycomyces blakesleeanus NRRL 1555(-)]OAD66047.1 hypothetical protein PHYBLDRAFT_69891 [Phycomyces blakesleeanus NRRL 1555(-)]|eukprot:XP_018284087.1 hypothetical protein PHYBLDRAFT_69891 [Phycomyces blakesleeanus NRRL 1555(-)]
MYFKASVSVWICLWIYYFALATCAPIGNLIQGPAYLVTPGGINLSSVSLVERYSEAPIPLAKPLGDQYTNDIGGNEASQIPRLQIDSIAQNVFSYLGRLRNILIKDINPPLQNAAGGVRGSVKKMISKGAQRLQ